MPDAPPTRRARVLRVVRVLVAGALLAFLLSRLDLEAVQGLFARLGAGTVAALLGLVFCLQLVLTERVHVLLRYLVESRGAGPRPLTRRSVFADWQIAAAYSAVLPSAVGGDVVRAMLLSKYLSPPDAHARGVAALVVDRLMGLAALCTTPLLFALWWGGEGTGHARLLVGAMTLAVGLVLWRAHVFVALAAKLVPLRFERVRQFFTGVEFGLREVPWSARAKVFAWSLVLQLVTGGFFELAASAWGLGPGVHPAIWVGLPTALVLTVLPVSIGGLGLRESLFAVVFTTAGLPAESGVALGLLWGLAGLLPALAGAALQTFRGEARSGGPDGSR